MSNTQVFTINHQITDFHIPENGVILNGLPKVDQVPILSEVEILRSKVELLEGEIQKTRDEAYQEGFSACKRSMETENKIEFQKQVEMIKQFKIGLEKEIKNSLSKLYQPIMDVSSTIAKKIIECELECSNKMVQMIQSKLEKYSSELANQKKITIKANSDCINFLQNNDFNPENIPSKLINFIPDDNLIFGECIIESDNHIIDATFQTQIKHIINQIS